MSNGKKAGFIVVLALATLGGCLSVARADTLYVNGVTGDDTWDGRCEVWDGSTCGPKATIQAGIDAAVAGDEVVIADGIYTGAGNRDLDFRNKSINVRSASGDPDLCVIDCQGTPAEHHRGMFVAGDNCVAGLTITHAYAGTGGGIYCWGRTTLTNCKICGNVATGGGGGVAAGGMLTLRQCTISENVGDSGGGIWGSSLVLDQCLVYGNTACVGGGIHCLEGGLTMMNCTIVRNTATGQIGGVFAYDTFTAMGNCILSDNSPHSLYADYAMATYSDIEDGTGQLWFGVGCIDTNPLFVDADGADNDPNTWANNDYRLAPGSPCIDSGSNAAVPADLLVDLDGLPRIADGNNDGVATVDMGAYERPATVLGDMNCDGVLNFGDINPFVQALMYPDEYVAEHPGCPILFADCSQDGTISFADINAFIDLLLAP